MARVLSAFVLLLLLCASASAQPGRPQLTWIRYFQLSPASRAEFVKTARVPFDKMVADGTIAAWAVLEPVSRVGEPWSHAIYVSVADWSAVDAVATALNAAAPTGSEHTRDVVVRHVMLSDTPPVAKPKYLVVNLHPITRGRDGDAIHLFNEWTAPILMKIAAGGKLGPWGVSTQSIVVDGQWTYMVWYFISDTSVLEEVHSALASVNFTQSQMYERRLRAMSEDDSLGQLLRVVHSAP
ncbi:MAG: hypothetical protein ACJ74H_01695 [Thermoanaerobaculia bacterium]